jgi:hypothetical protein
MLVCEAKDSLHGYCEPGASIPYLKQASGLLIKQEHKEKQEQGGKDVAGLI